MDIAHVTQIDLQSFFGQSHRLRGTMAAGSSEKGGIVLISKANLNREWPR